MSLFPKTPLYQPDFLFSTLPQEIRQGIEAGEYESAAESLITHKIPFATALRMISNCPKLLISYLYKQSSMFVSSHISQQLIWHMYLQFAIFNLDESEINRVSNFLIEHKNGLDKNLVLKWVLQAGETNLIQNACIAFNDYDTLVKHLLSSGQYLPLQYINNVSELTQRTAFLRALTNQTMQLTEMLSESYRPPINAIFDALVQLAIKVSRYEAQILKENITINFQTFYENGLFTEPAHFHMYLMFLISMKMESSILQFFETKEFQLIDKDFVAMMLIKNDMISLAAQLYAHVEERHSLAVEYALRQSQKFAIELLQSKQLKTAKDINSLWIQLLKACRDSPNSKSYNWVDLVSTANNSGVITLDDIFPLVPADIPMDPLNNIIAEAVQRSSNEIRRYEDQRKKIEERADAQRKILSKPNLTPIEINPLEATCFLCGQSVFDSQFEAYPCGHVVHTSCYLSSIDTKDILSLSESCPACGTASLIILDKPFITADDKEEEEKWAIPE